MLYVTMYNTLLRVVHYWVSVKQHKRFDRPKCIVRIASVALLQTLSSVTSSLKKITDNITIDFKSHGHKFILRLRQIDVF